MVSNTLAPYMIWIYLLYYTIKRASCILWEAYFSPVTVQKSRIAAAFYNKRSEYYIIETAMKSNRLHIAIKSG